MSYVLIRRLANVRSEFIAAKAAIDYLEKNWSRIHIEVGLQDQSFRKYAVRQQILKRLTSSVCFRHLKAFCEKSYPLVR